MKIELLQYLVVTAQCASITEAADRLFLHQTTLSSAIKNIEKTTGVEIFSRSKTGIVLTDAGKELVALAGEIVERWERIQSLSLKNMANQESLLLTPTLIADQYSLLFLSAYRKYAPQGNLSIATIPQNDFIPKMLTGKYKIGIGLEDPNNINYAKALFIKNDFIFTLLGTHESWLYVNEKSRFAARDAVSLYELQGEHLAISENGYHTFHTAEHTKVLGNPAILANIHLVRKAVEQENMIAFYIPCTSKKDDWFCNGTSIKKIKLLDQPSSCIKQSFLVHRPANCLSEAEKVLLQSISIIFENN